MGMAPRSLYEAVYECLAAFRLPSGSAVRPGDLARETELKGTEESHLDRGEVRLVGYVRKEAAAG